MRGVARRGSVFLLVVATVFAARPAAVRATATAPERLILAPAAGTTFRVQAVYPNSGVTCEAKRVKDLRARYRGRLEIVRRSNGRLALIDHVTFDEYLQGLSEMPRSWPAAALEAQVVAARTYALYELTHPRASGRALGYDICSTDQCQVYRGVSVEQGAFGEAWVKAVSSTRGKIMRYHGSPISAFYFSTSPGRTKRAFPGGTPLPYIHSVPGQDGDSPLANWTVKVPLADLGPILHASGDWPGGSVTSVRLSGDSVVVGGAGRSVTVTKGSFRFDLNDQAACVFPTKYPTATPSGAKLPQTVPSIDFTSARSGSAIVLTGRGWGHGVGMSQYGAKSLAEQGRSYADILAYYYAGIRPQTVTEPGDIRVLIVDGASLVRVAVEGTATATTDTGSALAPGDRFEVRGGDTLDIRRGVGPSAASILTLTLDSAEPISVPPDGTIVMSYTLSGASRVALAVRRDGREVFRTPEVSQISGANTFSLSLDTARASLAPGSPSSAGPSGSPSGSPSATAVAAAAVAPAPLAPGSYDVTLEAYDGLDRVRTAPVALTVQSRPTPAKPIVKSSSSWTWIVAFLAVLLLAGGAFAWQRRRQGPSVP